MTVSLFFFFLFWEVGVFIFWSATWCAQSKKRNQFHTTPSEKRYSLYLGSLSSYTFSQKATPSMMQDKKNSGFDSYLFQTSPPTPSSSTSCLLPVPYPLCFPSSVGQHLGGALGTSRGGRRGPAGFELGLVGVSRLRGRRGGRVPSLASLLEVALVPGGLGQHLHPALLVLLQASPELRALPLPLHLPGEAGSGFTFRRALSVKQLMS